MESVLFIFRALKVPFLNFLLLGLVFIVFTAPFLNVFIKLFYITGIFTHFSIVFCVLFLGFSLFHVWLFGMFGNITFRFFLHKHIKTPNHQEAIRSCSRCEFFTSDFINACEDIQSLITRLTIYHYSISKLKYQNLDLFSHLL